MHTLVADGLLDREGKFHVVPASEDGVRQTFVFQYRCIKLISKSVLHIRRVEHLPKSLEKRIPIHNS